MRKAVLLPRAPACAITNAILRKVYCRTRSSQNRRYRNLEVSPPNQPDSLQASCWAEPIAYLAIDRPSLRTSGPGLIHVFFDRRILAGVQSAQFISSTGSTRDHV